MDRISFKFCVPTKLMTDLCESLVKYIYNYNNHLLQQNVNSVKGF